ncbi:MAG: ABC transporter ATP-binding protein [Dehalococcoidia bacterium]
MIQLHDITKAYTMGKRELKVLQGINLDIEPGARVAIMGPSGSGKSTLLNLIGCLDRPTSGTYYLDDQNVGNFSSGELAKVRGQKIGFIFQSYHLLPQLSALANVDLGLRYSIGSKRHSAMEALEKVGLSDRANHRPTELSGGEQQRVAIARAFAKSPPIILADEPTGNLDSRSEEEIMSILMDFHTEEGITLIIITHESGIAHRCQRIIHMLDGQIAGEETG